MSEFESLTKIEEKKTNKKLAQLVQEMTDDM